MNIDNLILMLNSPNKDDVYLGINILETQHFTKKEKNKILRGIGRYYGGKWSNFLGLTKGWIRTDISDKIIIARGNSIEIY